MDDLFTQWKDMQVKLGLSDDDIAEKFDGIVRLSSVTVFSKFYDSLTEEEKKQIEAIVDDKEAETFLEELYVKKHGKTIGEEVELVQKEFLKAYIDGKLPDETGK